MPNFIKTKEDERLWQKAKDIAEDQGHKEDWPYVTGVYKKMRGGKVAGETVKKIARSDLRDRFVEGEKQGKSDLTQSYDHVQKMAGRFLTLVKEGFKKASNSIIEPEDDPLGFLRWLDAVSDLAYLTGKLYGMSLVRNVSKKTASDLEPVGTSYSLTPYALTKLLSTLEAIQRFYWTAHWTAKGDPQYGDHLLFQRLYESMADEIDGLAEKIVAQQGEQGVDPVIRAELTYHQLRTWQTLEGSAVERALLIESDFQETINGILKAGEVEGWLTTGVTNFLEDLADKHETTQYLLGQRNKIAAKVAARWALINRVAHPVRSVPKSEIPLKLQQLADQVMAAIKTRIARPEKGDPDPFWFGGIPKMTWFKQIGWPTNDDTSYTAVITAPDVVIADLQITMRMSDGKFLRAGTWESRPRPVKFYVELYIGTVRHGRKIKSPPVETPPWWLPHRVAKSDKEIGKAIYDATDKLLKGKDEISLAAVAKAATKALDEEISPTDAKHYLSGSSYDVHGGKVSVK